MLQRHLRHIILFAFFCIFSSTAVFANPESTADTPPSSNTPPATLLPAPPDLKVKAYVLMDAQSGRILAQKNMDQKLPPASLTKMMTMYLASRALETGAIHLDDKVTISKKAWQMGGSKMFIKVGTEVSVQDLINGIIVDSGNDACVAMAEYVAGVESSFVDMMNTEAKNLGMLSTHYVDCTGLPNADHYSTAQDLAFLARAIVLNFPNDYEWYKSKWFTYNGIRQPNRNRLLWRYPYADGLKTGHTDEAGYCLVASALKDGMRLITVILGAPNDEARAQDSISLFTYGFRFFESHPVYQANNTITESRVWFGSPKKVRAGVTHDFSIITTRGQFPNVKVAVTPDDNLKAPIQKGEKVGTIVATLDGNIIAQTDLVALDAVARGGLWRRGMDHIGHLFHGWFGSKKTTPSQ